MKTEGQLKLAVTEAKAALEKAEQALAEFLQSAENNRYDTLDDAFELEWDLRERASEDCEGSYNCGADEYSQEFYVGDKRYVAILYNIEYNRHDKRYYFLDYAKFRIEDEEGNKYEG